MGYYTAYNLNVLEGGDEFEIIAEFRKYSESAKYALDEEGCCDETCKWYNHETELVSFSKKYPDAIFQLQGEGEENGDAWKLYVKDGHSQLCKARLVYDEFDKGKLLADIRNSKIDKVIE